MLQQNLHIAVLKDNIEKISNALISFKKSLEKCESIGIKEMYTFEELEAFDSLTVKFARISDILTQKVLRTIFILLREDNLTFIDICKKAEKHQLIDDADSLLSIRDIRNQVSHDYNDENLKTLYADIFKLSPQLESAIQNVIAFSKRYNWI